MNGLLMIAIAIIVLGGAYLLYGRWLANKWGIDPKAKTPAYELEDGEDYIPTSKGVVFSHQFSSIAGAGPVTGPILAAAFGWLPVLLWLLIGGIFFGAVHDFGAMYASVKNKGKSMGFLIEKYIGKTGKKLFSLFAWIFSLLVIAAFSDIVANTFNGFNADGSKNTPNASAASISMLFIVVSIAFGFYLKYKKPSSKLQFVIGIVLLIAMLAVGIKFPMYFNRNVWLGVVFVYIFFAAIAPMWVTMQPRDYLSSFLLIGMILGAVIGIIVANPSMNLPAVTSFNVNGSNMFPTLFITIACGAISGFHSLVSSGTSSKQIKNEKDMLPCTYGAMNVETLLGVVALVVVGAASVGGKLPEGTPFSIFAGSVAGFLEKLGISQHVAVCFMTMCVSALAFTTLDSVARIARMFFQELFIDDSTDMEHLSPVVKFLTNKYVSTFITLFLGFLLSLGGYNNVWPLFGSANQLLSALVLITLAVFLRVTNRKGFMLWIPMCLMLVVTFTSLVTATINIFKKLFVTGNFVILTDGLQLLFALLLMVLGLLVAISSFKKLLNKNIVKEEVSTANN